MITEGSNELRCFWCNSPGAGDANTGGCIVNGITFCWQSGDCPFNICGEILGKINTMVDNYECPVCMETKKALEMPNCNHKVCLDCYKTIYFGVSEIEKPCEYRDLCDKIPEWTYEQQFDEEGYVIENEKQNEHDGFLNEKMNYQREEDERKYDELIVLRDNLIGERSEWMNISEIINYENELFRVCTEWINKQDIYLSNLTIGNQSCPLCRAVIEYK
jgi:hypothetical protein